MGALFRFPFFTIGMLFWFSAGLLVTLVQFCFIPLGIFVSLLSSELHFSVMDVLTFKTYRNGFRNLYRFLNGY